MLISELGIRGFKSYGNNEQVLKLNTEKGELILLVGNNGAGKSSLLDSFDYTLYGKVRGRKKKWATLSTLPNRINGELLNRIKFNSLGTDVEIKRGISPGVLELTENGVVNERAGKGNVDEKIEKYIGMDIETFKSFISMSINDFKNFISLSNEEKQLLLDKLFNLEVINILNGILKDIAKNNKVRAASFDAEIRTLDDSISSIQRSIDKAIERQKEMAKIVNATNLSIQQREEMVVKEGERRAKEIQLMKNDMDAQALLKQNELAQIHALQELEVIKAKTEIELINIQKAKENVALAAQLQKNKTILEYSQFQKDSISKKQQEASAKDIQKMKNYVPVNITSPNYLRDEKNTCFPWNAVTERVYEIKNTDGYVVTVIVIFFF